MKIIDNTQLAEQEKAQNEERERRLKRPLGSWLSDKKKEEDSNTITLVLDWRLAGQYAKAVNENLLFVHQKRETEQNFLRHAITERGKLKELIVEGYDPNPNNKIEILSDKETISELQKEAQKIGLDFPTYIRSIFYTTAYNINKAEEARKEEVLKKQEELKTFEFTGRINQELRKKLDEKFGEPDRSMMFYRNDEEYGNRLIQLANEYFGNAKGDNN